MSDLARDGDFCLNPNLVISDERIVVFVGQIGESNANSTDRLGLLHSLISNWLLHLSDFESPFAVLGLGFWTLIGVVILLVAAITLHSSYQPH